MPVLNGEAYLQRAIDSFLDQNYPYKELIIVDGMSTDNSHKIIADAVVAFPGEIRWVKEVDNGLSNARNIGLKYATGDLVGIMASDDVLHRGVFEKMAYYSSVCEFDVIYFSCYVHYWEVAECYNYNLPLNKLKAKSLLKGDHISFGECFYYKKDIFDLFKFDETLKCVMDYEFNLRLMTYDKRKFFWFAIHDPGLIRFLHPECVSIKQRHLSLWEKEEVVKKYCAKSKIYPLWKRRLRKLLGMQY